VAPFYGQARTRGTGSHLYYRMPDGWIHAQPVGRAIDGEFQNARKLERQGWEPLWRYGRFDFLPYHVEREFEWLFQAGGAHEMPLDQVVTLGYHLRPPLVPSCGARVGQRGHVDSEGSVHGHACWEEAEPVVFPQLAGEEIPGPFPCPYCEREFPLEKQQRAHISVMHKDELATDRLSRSLVEGLGKREPNPPPAFPARGLASE
jgi:hypothetical protein